MLFCAGATAAQEWRVLALRADFPLESPDESTTTGLGAFDLRFAVDASDDYAPPFDLPPHDRTYFEKHLRALDRYYRTVSEGRVEIAAEVFPREQRLAYTLPRSMLHYGNGRTTEEIGAKWIELLRDALQLALADPDGPALSDYNSFLVFHAGVGHETGQLNDIRSVFLEQSDFARFNGGPLEIGGIEIDEAWILPESPSNNGRGGLNGLMAKFFGNQLGLPGLSNFADGLPALGSWSLMDVGANALGFARIDSLEPVVGFVAPHPMAWSKVRLGWIEPLVVRRDTVVSLLVTDRAGDLPKAIRVPIDADEYYLLENRQRRGRVGAPDGQQVRGVEPDEVVWIDQADIELDHGVWTGVEDYDLFIPGSGVLIWHIDEGIIAEHIAASAINNRPEHQGIALEEADGYRDIGNPVFERLRQIEGSPDDPFYGGGQTLFGPTTQPSTRSNRGWETGLEIEVLSQNGDTMQVAIRFGRSRPGWPLALAGDGLLQAADLDGDGAQELMFEADGGVGLADGVGAVAWWVAGARLLAAGDVDGDGQRELFLRRGAEVGAWALGAGAPLWTRAIAEAEAVFSDGLDSFIGFGDPALALIGTDEIEVLEAASGAALERVPRNGGPPMRADGSTAPHAAFPVAADGGLPPVLGDLDGDGHAEWVVADRGGVVRWGDRSVALGDSLVAAPALGDLDGDGTLEVVLAAAGATIHALRYDGIRQADYPYALPRFAAAGELRFEPVLCDIDGDGRQEIFVAGRSGVFAIDDGQLLSGFPLLTATAPVAAPVVLDLDGDGRLELAALDAEALYVWDPQRVDAGYGGTAAHWPQARADAAGTRSLVAVAPAVAPQEALLDKAYCYPNPVGAGAAAHVRFALRETALVELNIFDALGAHVERQRMGEMAGGENEIAWSVEDYPSGLYICKLAATSDGRQDEVLVRMAVSR